MVLRLTMAGMHEGRCAGVEPTGNRVTGTNIAFYGPKDGSIVERWLETDNLDALQQLDLLPEDISDVRMPADD